jgi:NAD(P)H-quinone oxidoreductase subunit 4L
VQGALGLSFPLEITLNHFLVLSSILFSIGLFGTLSKRNAVAILMCIELMLNAVNIALVAFARFMPPSSVAVAGSQGPYPVLGGQIFALFVISVAAAEAAVGLAIVLAVYRNRRTVVAENIDLMKW